MTLRRTEGLEAWELQSEREAKERFKNRLMQSGYTEAQAEAKSVEVAIESERRMKRQAQENYEKKRKEENERYK